MIELSCNGCPEVVETISNILRALQYWGVRYKDTLREEHFCPKCSKEYLPSNLSSGAKENA